MPDQKVFFVHLRRPNNEPNERRDDPFYEFGSFGCTGCHSKNLFHPRHAEYLEGARLAFAQGGHHGFRLVFLTPPIEVKVWEDRCEARWIPEAMPFKYASAPILVQNLNEHSEFPLVKKFALEAKRRPIEGGFSSRIRTRVHPLPVDLAREIIEIYQRKRSQAQPSEIAVYYNETLPYDPPIVDQRRKTTYERHIERLSRNENSENTPCIKESTLKSEIKKSCNKTILDSPRNRKNKCS